MISSRGRYFAAFLFAAFLIAVSLVSCLSPFNPPPLSFSKFVRDPGEDRKSGKISFSTGAAAGIEQPIGEDDPRTGESRSYLLLFPSEGALSMWLGEYYDLTFSVGASLNLGVEGNLSLALSDALRLGFVHGVGLSFMGDITSRGDYWTGYIFPGFSAGMFMQYSHSGIGAAFLGIKYTYGIFARLGGDPRQADPDSGTHYISGSVGHSFLAGRLRITPEFIMCYGDWHYEDNNQVTPTERNFDLFAFILLITLAAAY